MCKKCGKTIETKEIFRTSSCPFCGADLHSCINCKFYAPGSHYDCHESVEEVVYDKEKANFCDYFSVNSNPSSVESNFLEERNKNRQAFNSLFKS